MSASVLLRRQCARASYSIGPAQLAVGRRPLPPLSYRTPLGNRQQPFAAAGRAFSSATSKTEDGAKADSGEKKEPATSQTTSSGNGGAKSKSGDGATTKTDRSLMDEQTLEWEDKVDYSGVRKFADLPYPEFGYNQHMLINSEFKRALADVIRTFQAPIIYAFAYGSGVFPQSKGSGRTPTDEEIHAVHPKPDSAIVQSQGETPKMIDFIFGVSHTQHFHSLNMRQNRDHYSGLARLGSGAVSRVQDNYGAGVYFNPYVTVNGVSIKYGVVNIDTLCKDLFEWDTLYLAGRLHKPVKIIRDNARVRLANQTNLLAAVRTALLMLPERFSERQLYATIAGLSYLGDPRMRLPAENPQKVANIVGNNAVHFRRLYAPLVHVLPNVEYEGNPLRAGPEDNLSMRQDMGDHTRGNMVRRLPRQFRSRLYFQYQKKWQIPRLEFESLTENIKSEDGGVAPGGRQGGDFDKQIAQDTAESRREILRGVVKKTIEWPSTAQSLKGILTSGVRRSLRYAGEKVDKYREGKKKGVEEKKEEDEKPLLDSDSSSKSTASSRQSEQVKQRGFTTAASSSPSSKKSSTWISSSSPSDPARKAAEVPLQSLHWTTLFMRFGTRFIIPATITVSVVSLLFVYFSGI